MKIPSRIQEVCLGLERAVGEEAHRLRGQRLGLLCNQASVDRGLRHARDLISETFPGQLRCLFSPQHGFFSARQDNMIESDHSVDPVSGLPVYSLYGETRIPYPVWFDEIDCLLIDLVDVGTRVYTFAWTMVNCLHVAARTGTRVVILDRPNPLGGAVEGNLLKEECRSFVGLLEIPMQHGLTLGELGRLAAKELKLDCELEVVRLEGWDRSMEFPQTGLPWIFPSPNLPGFASARVYPGQVIWEGTNVSEGRGTTLPFELFGAPFIRCDQVLAHLDPADVQGCFLRPLAFEPTSGKWQGQTCHGFQLHVTDSSVFRSYRTSLALFQVIRRLYPDEFSYKKPPYEYEYERLPLDLILGDKQVRLNLEQGVSVQEMERAWQDELEEYQERARAVFLYGPDKMH